MCAVCKLSVVSVGFIVVFGLPCPKYADFPHQFELVSLCMEHGWPALAAGELIESHR